MKKLYTSVGGALFLFFCTLLTIQPLHKEAFCAVQLPQKPAGNLEQNDVFKQMTAGWSQRKTSRAASQPSDSLSRSLFKKMLAAPGRRSPVKREAPKRTYRAQDAARKSASAAVPPIVYVNSNAGGDNSGTSWENPFWDLAQALKYAHDNSGVEQIWVANGTYYPDYDSNYEFQYDEDAVNRTFLLPPDIKIYGGFRGNEQSPAERELNIAEGNQVADFESDEEIVTVLDGRNTSYHVVTYAGEAGDAILDGFIIRGGNANGESSASINGRSIPRNVGGGIVAIYSSPSLRNLLITGNYATDGSGIYASGSSLALTNAIVSANPVNGQGAVYLLNSSAIFTNTTISAIAGQTSAAVVLEGAAPKIRNTIISASLSTSGVAVEVGEGTVPYFSNSIVPGSGGSGSWNAAYGKDQGGNLDVDPGFFDESKGVLGLRPGSPAVNKGNNLFLQSGQIPNLSTITTDPRGTPRITKSTVDIGALESVYETLSTTLIPNENGILFVKKGGSGSKNGSDWNNAAAEVADAIVASYIKDIKQIWVAGGTYHPLYRPDNLSNADPKSPLNSFLLTGEIQLYGGFKGTESSLADRDLRLKENASILSGDFNQDDNFDFMDFYNNGARNEFSENAHHVIYGLFLNSDHLLDGFTIEGANNMSSSEDETTLILETAVPTAFGAGIFIYQTRKPVYLENLIIRNNLGNIGGGCMGFLAGSLFMNCLIYHNYDKGYGSGILDGFNTEGIAILSTTVTQNLSESNFNGLGVVVIDGIGTGIFNSIIAKNIARGADGPYQRSLSIDGALVAITNSIVEGTGGSANWLFSDDDEYHDNGGNLDTDPQFADMDGGDFSLAACSRAIDAGDVSPYPSNILPKTDLGGNSRVFNDQIDIGAFEFQGVRPPNADALAGNAKTSSFTLDEEIMAPHTFTAAGATCDADLLTLMPDNVSGEVTATVWVDAQVNSYGGAVYLQRHFDITPSENPASSSGRVTVYFTQAEFDALNAKLSPPDYLPTGQPEGEDERKANLRIYQFHGSSSDGSGSPASYTDSRIVIDPDDNDITWNAKLNRWEVTFSVEGFSGFFGGTVGQNPLPVKLISFEGRQTDDQQIKLDWKVAEQENIQIYEIEYSANGKNFAKIGEVNANILTNTAYSYTDSLTHAGDRAYYRLKILEFDGKTGYSKLISLKLSHNAGIVAYPVPAKNELWIDWKKTNAQSAEFIDSNGRILKTIKKSSGVQKVDISGLPGGLFFLKTEGNAVLKVVKE
ncbi:choice-of-anchor Q domain-containing protein [Dyadobacter sp. Leaf189]|uniref:choice-of-anchor Q domain-containing protein n=1 Tax=Dyadobacter sp. Leaf189 TaxID=1736295 RepID=UPI0006F2203C|nr:choice-of-anchor Q domain-containing protein [Dyadobacter sp. Leaf189]KQS32899.1 hypothetical protein ASG33_01995 [Dyadobacter sp. Leaf189]